VVKLGIAVGAAAYFFMSGATMLVGVFQKHAAMWRAALAELLSRLLLVILVALLAYWHSGVVAMIAALIAANALWFVLTIWLARPLVRIRPRADWLIWKQTLARSWPIAVSIVFNLLYLRGDIFILSLFRSPTEVGFYGVAYKLLDVLTALPVMFMGLILPALVADWTAGRVAEFQKHLGRIFDLFMIVALPIIFGTVILARPLVVFIAGAAFIPAVPVLQLLIVTLFGIFLGALYGHAVVAVNRQRQMVWGYVLTAVLSLAGYFLFVPAYGMYAAAAVTIFSEIFMAGLTFFMVWKTSRALPSLAATNQVLLACGFMSVVLLLLPPLPVLLSVALGAAVYLLALYLLGGIKKEDLRLLLPHNTSS
jgi:O-antigen/teichoic acid export membrane protein